MGKSPYLSHLQQFLADNVPASLSSFTIQVQDDEVMLVGTDLRPAGAEVLPTWLKRRNEVARLLTPYDGLSLVTLQSIELWLRHPRRVILRQFGRWYDFYTVTKRTDEGVVLHKVGVAGQLYLVARFTKPTESFTRGGEAGQQYRAMRHVYNEVPWQVVSIKGEVTDVYPLLLAPAERKGHAPSGTIMLAADLPGGLPVMVLAETFHTSNVALARLDSLK